MGLRVSPEAFVGEWSLSFADIDFVNVKPAASRMHPVSTAGGADFVVSSPDAIDLVLYDCSNSLEAVIGEGEDFNSVDIVDPKHSIFGPELIGQVPQQGFIAAKDLRGPPDREDMGDCRHGSSGRRHERGCPEVC